MLRPLTRYRCCGKIKCVLLLLSESLHTASRATRSSGSFRVVRPETISANVSVRRVRGGRESLGQRPTVLLYSWMLAKPKHIDHYGDIYLDKGFDVINIKIKPMQVVWPACSQAVAQQVVDLLVDGPGKQGPILMHGFSVGGYMYAETLVKIVENPILKKEIGSRIRGQILDSPVASSEISEAYPQAVTQNRLLQTFLQGAIAGYLRAFPNMVNRHYERASEVFHDNVLRTPSLFLYALNDPIAVPRPIRAVVARWKAEGIPVWSKCWERSRHVSHLHYHPAEYITTLNQFLQDMGLLQETETEEKEEDLEDNRKQAVVAS